MKEFIAKTINSLAALALALVVVAGTYHLTSHEGGRLSASILDGHSPGDILEIQFVSPKGSAYPVNGVVTIQSVFVDAGGGDIGNVSGSDLENSFITFVKGSTPCPLGTVYNNNQIILPDTFNTSCTVDISVDGGVTTENDAELTIEPVSCAQLRTSILRSYGEGFENIDSGDLGHFGSTPNGFDFTTITDSVNINYPTTDVDGAKTFQIHVELAPDISVDPINGIDQRAKIFANNNNGVYEIKIRDEGDNTVQTSLNFAYVFNDLLGPDTPFVAFPDPTNVNASEIILQATEMGTHSDDYTCVVDGIQVGPPCFTGGGDGQNEGLGVLTTPLKLDNEILQGETQIVFASSSAGEVEWISSHPSVLEVTTLSEASEEETGSIDFVDETITVLEAVTPGEGAYNLLDCSVDLDENNVPIANTENCTLEVSIPIEYDVSGIDYTVNVAVGDEVVPVTVGGGKLTGFLEGSGEYDSVNGVSMSVMGTVSGTVTGSVSGIYSGTVTGKVVADVQASGSAPGNGSNGVDASHFTANMVVGVVTEGALTDVPNTFTTTIKKQEDDISHVALAYAKRPGISILSALDTQGCIASFDIEVVRKQVLLQMVGRDPGDVLDVSDTVQINAFVGGANSELDEYDNITAASGIEYFSSNEEVANIDETGLLTALKPGVTNITARYDTGDTEIGTIESVPLSVTVNKIAGLRVSFDKGTESLLPAVTVENAKKSVMIAVHSPEAAGHTLYIEGQTVDIQLPAGTYNNDISKVEAIADQLVTDIEALQNDLPLPTAVPVEDIIDVTRIDGYPGMLILQPTDAQDGEDNNDNSIEDINENGIIDVDTSALETHLSILPTYNNAIPLPASKTYGLMVVAQYDNGATKVLPPTQFSWVNTPVNYLQQASLDSGLIKMGEIAGTSTVVAEYENADSSVVQSNYLTITVDSGPVIEYVRRIGSAAVSKGSRITLQTKISDVDTVSDITSISSSLVYSNFNTYQQINEDAGAIWFTATPFLNEMQVVDTGSTETTEGDTEGTDGETSSEPQTISLQYKTYNIPIEIPADANLFDGVYKMILSVTDASNHTLNYVYPIRIGEIAGGDVDGSGSVNMIDVILAFQIASGVNKSPTPAQLQAANVDGVGGVTLIDVILLFNKVTNKQ